MPRSERPDEAPPPRRDEAHTDTPNVAPDASLDVYERALRRILWTLRIYLSDIVVIGGWVPHLYRRYGGFRAWNGRLSLTAEVDVLVSTTLDTGSRPPIAELLAAEGFTPAGRRERLSLSTARNNLDGLLRGALRPVIAEVAEALVQRDSVESVEAARADVEGHLTDLSEDIADVLT